MEQLIFLRDHIMRILILIIRIVAYTVILLILNHNTMIKTKDNHQLKVVWVLLPGLVLLLVALPSVRLPYRSEETKETPLALKTLGHQWYWSYKYSGFKETEVDSFMLPLEKKIFRLLETDNALELKKYSNIRLFDGCATFLPHLYQQYLIFLYWVEVSLERMTTPFDSKQVKLRAPLHLVDPLISSNSLVDHPISSTSTWWTPIP